MIKPFTGCLLTQGQITFYDLEDAEKVEKFKWHAKWSKDTQSFYVQTNFRIGGKRTILRMHRLIMELEKGDQRKVDHINHNTLDNRKENLRIVTNQQNCQNVRDVKGYSWDKTNNQWLARIKVDQKTIHLGRFNVESEARDAYLNARIKYGFINSNI